MTDQPSAPPLAYRPKAAAAALGIGESTLYKMIKRGEVRTRKLGSATVIARAEILRLAGAPPEAK